MVDIRRILCPTDFSDASRHALEHAVAIARWYQSQITALHVVHSEFLLEPPTFFTESSRSAELTQAERHVTEEQLGAWLEPVARTGVKIDMLCDGGNPALRILDRAGSLRADLIVMGTHGVSGLERLMLGSVTEKVLHKAACPVMTVPPPAAANVSVPYTRLLCPVDFSESSLAALRFAFSLAEEADAHLTILYVVEWPSDENQLVKRFEVVEVRRQVEDEARRRLEALVPADVRVWCKPVTKVSYGKPYRQILATAESDATDLVVIGIRGRNALDLTLFGSTTNQIVRRASCPVLTLKQ